MYSVDLTKRARKDLKLLKESDCYERAIELFKIMEQNPYQTPPGFKKLSGDLKGYYSRRINGQHRIVYDILPNSEKLRDKFGEIYQGIVRVISMWTHYE